MDNIKEEMIKLSIIIVSYNTCDLTLQTIRSIYESDIDFDFEIIVVDNNSTDDSVNCIEKAYPDVIIINNKTNNMFAKANNQGAKIAKGKYLLLLNSDTIVEGNNIAGLVHYFDKLDNEVICVGPKILNRDLTLQSAGFPLPSVSERLVMSCKLYKIFPSFVSKYFFPKGTPYKIHGNIPMRECGWVSGACMLVRKKEYLECGGLNENLIFYGEEPEFGYRACKLGYKTLYNPNFYIIHLGGQSVKKENKKHNDDIIRFERYSRLQEETVGYKKAIVMSQVVVAVLYFKGLFYKNKSQIKEFIRYEKSLIKYMKLKNEETINRH